MPDYFQVLLTGFSTGLGVISANEIWQFIKKYRLHKLPYDMANEIMDDLKDKGVRRR
jgi:hypothetical protein